MVKSNVNYVQLPIKNKKNKNMNSRYILLMHLINRQANKMLIAVGLISLFCLTFNVAAKEYPKVNGKYEFSISAQSLDKSLNILSDISKISFLFPYDLVTNKTGKPVHGRYSVQEALNLLLEGSNLEGVLSNKKAFLIKPLKVKEANNNNFGEVNMKTQKTILASIFTLLFSTVNAAEEPVKNDTSKTGENKEVVERIVVAGFRGSIQAAQDLKRDASSVVEAVTFEDLGKFSDENIADALQRIPGLQVDRNDAGAGGDRVSIRGLGPQFTTTTVNGRTPLSSGSEGIADLRTFNLDVIPPEILSGLVVHKTPTSDNVVSGLGGNVDLKTLRPLEVNYGDKSYVGSISVSGEYDELSSSTGPRLSALISKKSEDETFAFSIAAIYSESDRLRNQIALNEATSSVNIDLNENGVLDDGETRTLTRPNTLINNPIDEERERTAISTALQYKPTDNFELIADFTYSKYDNRSFRANSRSVQGGVFSGLFSPDAIQINEENGTVIGYDLARDPDGDPSTFDGFTPGVNGSDLIVQTSNLKFDNFSESILGGVNAKWVLNDSWVVSADLSFSQIDFEQDLRTANFRASSTLDQDSISFVSDGAYAVQKFGSDISDASNFSIFNTAIREISLDGDQWAAKVDFGYDIASDYYLQFGIRYSEMELESIATAFNVLTVPEEDRAEYEAAALNGSTQQDFISGVANYPTVSYLGAVSVFPELDSTTGDALSSSPLSEFIFEENVTALYAKLDFWGEFVKPYSANFGLRAVHTENISHGNVSNDGVISPITFDDSYWELLPSFNINFDVDDDTNLRFSVSKVMSRPNPTDMVPSISIAAINDSGIPPVATTGNPELEPYTAWQLDTTLELYNESEGAIILSAFYKDVSDFILTGPGEVSTIPGLDGEFTVIQPVNFSDGQLYGFEAGFNQPFTFLPEPFDSMGLQANYTYISSEFDEDVGDAGFGFPGASENNFNAVAYFERNGFSARLAYTFRDDYFRALSTAQTVGLQQFSEAEEQLNVNFSYEVSDNLQLTASVVNITEQERRDFRLDKSNFQGFFERGRLYLFGVRYKL